jgi:cation:H+ antiporter
MIFLYSVVLLLAFAVLVKGADIFVDGSSNLARILKIPGVVIGLTVVAMGTSMPELAVSVSASVQGANEIALSNVVGSNIFNLLGILGVCALIKPLPVERSILRRDFPVSISTTLLVFIVVALGSFFGGGFLNLGMDENAGVVSRLFGFVMIALFLVYIASLVECARRNPEPESAESEKKKGTPLWKCLLFIALGLGLIIAGGKAVVFASRNIALFFGMSETLIGLTIVAVGTSLPELVTSIVAARKGEVDLAVGNILGSNIFNLLFILGLSALIAPVSVNAASVYDLLILIFVSALSWIFSITKRRIGRFEGAVMVLLYIGSMIFAILR